MYIYTHLSLSLYIYIDGIGTPDPNSIDSLNWRFWYALASLTLSLNWLTGALVGAVVMILSDLSANTLFYDPIFGGDPVLYWRRGWGRWGPHS